LPKKAEKEVQKLPSFSRGSIEAPEGSFLRGQVENRAFMVLVLGLSAKAEKRYRIALPLGPVKTIFEVCCFQLILGRKLHGVPCL